MELLMSQRFCRAYDRASLGLKVLTEGAVHDLVNRWRMQPKTFLQSYGKVQGLRHPIWEVDLSRSHRMLMTHEDSRLMLLDMGGHSVVNRYTVAKAQQDKLNNQTAYPVFWPEKAGFFRRLPDRTVPLEWQEERIAAEWLYFLSKEQDRVERKIRNRIFRWIDGGRVPTPHFIIGGPGTGKTCILLNLLRFFCDIDQTFATKIVISSQVAKYVERSTSADLGSYRRITASERYSCDLLLIDDPSSMPAIAADLQDRVSNGVATVIAFDPIQLDKAISDQEFDELVERFNVTVYELSACYRQKENVGGVTRHIINRIAESTPYLAESKIANFRVAHERLTRLANNLEFVNPAGYVQYYPDATLLDIAGEVKRIRELEWLMWRHHPGLLVIEGLNAGYVLSDAANGLLAPLEEAGYVQRASLHHLAPFKGLEFQHVFVFIDKKLYAELQKGFSGTGRRIYDQRRLFRIPFSRAKDSIVIFAM